MEVKITEINFAFNLEINQELTRHHHPHFSTEIVLASTFLILVILIFLA